MQYINWFALLALIGRLPLISFAIMKTVLLLLGLIFVVPTISYPSHRQSDCDENCLECVNPKSYYPKCRRCKEGYAQVKIYYRRKCERDCSGIQVRFWDPVTRSYVCDTREDCYRGSKCVKCLGSGSCVQCKRHYALKQAFKNILAINKCVDDCETCAEPQSGALVCKTSADACANPHRTTQAPSTSQQNTHHTLAYSKAATAAVGINPSNTTAGSSTTDPNPEPTTDEPTAYSSEYTDPTVVETDDDDDY